MHASKRNQRIDSVRKTGKNHRRMKHLNEYQLAEIWKEHLRKFNGILRLDSLIIKAMGEACRQTIELNARVELTDKSKNNEQEKS